MAEKECKYCHMKIPKKASICPYCRKKQGATLLTAIAVFFIIILLSSYLRQTSHAPSQQNGDQNSSDRSSILHQIKDSPQIPKKEEPEVVNNTSNLPDIHVQASDFINARSNPNRNRQYEGRTLVITGKISGIFIPPPSVVMRMAEKGLAAQPFIYFGDTPVSDVKDTLMGNGISCYLDRSVVTFVSQMYIGQLTTLRCRCTGLYTLEDCTLSGETTPIRNAEPVEKEGKIVLPYNKDNQSEWNEYTIMPEDFKRTDAPTFEQYKVPIKFQGKPAPVKIKSHPEAKTFRTMLKEGSKNGPNFADHMTIVFWGCGTNCTSIAFVDARNGQVYFDDKLTSNSSVNIHDKAYDHIMSYRRDSNLLIVAGCPNEECSTRRGVNYFLWTGEGLKEIFRVPRGWYPEK